MADKTVMLNTTPNPDSCSSARLFIPCLSQALTPQLRIHFALCLAISPAWPVPADLDLLQRTDLLPSTRPDRSMRLWARSGCDDGSGFADDCGSSCWSSPTVTIRDHPRSSRTCAGGTTLPAQCPRSAGGSALNVFLSSSRASAICRTPPACATTT